MSWHGFIAHPFLFLSIPLYACTSFHLPIVGHLGCFQFGMIMSKDAVNISVLVLCGQKDNFVILDQLSIHVVAQLLGCIVRLSLAL